ncbi:hypothetical protein WBJ53_18785 [Spirosoma sp. SC4-14]|uniref:hypothetical protein n=1 Tax=Spirosoma sp. SC4-14 TaxID=3128900 RepID=UPI0030CD4DC4
MKSILTFLLCLMAQQAIGQRFPDRVDPEAWKPPYNLAVPDGWTTERFPIPIDFAPQIPYKGVEELRFTPGWGKRTSAEYWSYAYLWWLEGSPTITALSLQANLTAYYAGLVSRNSTSRHGLTTKGVDTTTQLKKIRSTGAGEVYSGTIVMLDYMAQTPIILNCRIHVDRCREQNHTAVFVEISPKPAQNPTWKKLDALYGSFVCKK